MPTKSQPDADVFDFLMAHAGAPDRYSCAERLMLASHLVKDAHCPTTRRTPPEVERLLGRARDIIRSVDKELAREITASVTNTRP